MNQPQSPQNSVSVPPVERVQIHKLVIYDITPLDMEMLRRAALEPVSPPDTLDLTFSTFLLSVAASAVFGIVGLAATGTQVKTWAYPVLGIITAISLVAGFYLWARYQKAIAIFKQKQENQVREVERLFEEIKNRPLPQGQPHPEAMHPAPESRQLPP